MSPLTAQQRHEQDMDSRDEGPSPLIMIPVATEEDKHLPDIQAPGRTTLTQHTSVCALNLNCPQIGFIPFILVIKELGTWDLRPDSQCEPAAPVDLKRWDAVTPELYPYKIYLSEEKKGNTAPCRISFPGCTAAPGPELWLDVMKVVAAAVLCPGLEIILEKSKSLHLRPRGAFLHQQLTTFSPFPPSLPSLWNLPCEWGNAHGLPILNFRWWSMHAWSATGRGWWIHLMYIAVVQPKKFVTSIAVFWSNI